MVKDYVVYYLWVGNKNDVKFCVDFVKVIIINVTIMMIMVFDNTEGSL